MAEAQISTPMCDKFPDRPAVAKFRWQHGLEGFCSSESQFLLEQQAKNCRQQVTFAPLVAVEPALGRSERTQLIAAQLSAEAEADDTKRRAAKLYDQNKELRISLEHGRVMATEKEAQNVDLLVAVEKLEAARDRYALEAGELVLKVESMTEESASAKETEAQIADMRTEVTKARDTVHNAELNVRIANQARDEAKKAWDLADIALQNEQAKTADLTEQLNAASE